MTMALYSRRAGAWWAWGSTWTHILATCCGGWQLCLRLDTVLAIDWIYVFFCMLWWLAGDLKWLHTYSSQKESPCGTQTDYRWLYNWPIWSEILHIVILDLFWPQMTPGDISQPWLTKLRLSFFTESDWPQLIIFTEDHRLDHSTCKNWHML